MKENKQIALTGSLKIIGLILVLLLVVLLFLGFQATQRISELSLESSNSVQQQSSDFTQISAEQLLQIDDRSSITVQVNGELLEVELVNTPQSITQGLSGRPGLRSDGMLFVLPTSNQIPTFWMKDMRFPIDIVWIGGPNKSTVVDITQNVPAPPSSALESELPLYSATRPVSLVLEIEAGRSNELQLNSGDTLQFFIAE